MRIKIISVFFVLILMVSQCKKTEPTFSGAKVKTLTNLHSGYIDTYTYDGKGNVSLIQNSIGEKVMFTYNGDTIIMQSINGASVIYSQTDYILHGQTCADTSYGKYQAQNVSAKYSYNSDNQVTQIKNYAFGSLNSVADYTVSNKNVTEVNITDAATNTHSYFFYDYYTANNNTVGSQNFGKGFLGYGSAYALKTLVQLGQNNDTVAITSYRYKFDANSSIDTLVSYDRHGNLIDSIAYTYY